jgi:hypothetical protein
MSRGRYTTTAPDPWPQRCCVKCRTPFMCALASCKCHVEFTKPAPPDGWVTWDQVVWAQNKVQRYDYLADPLGWANRWFIDNLIKTRPGNRKEYL